MRSRLIQLIELSLNSSRSVKHNTILGKAIKTPTVITSATKNGAHPLKTSCTGMSGRTATYHKAI